jgi:hypothetical protein
MPRTPKQNRRRHKNENGDRLKALSLRQFLDGTQCLYIAMLLLC